MANPAIVAGFAIMKLLLVFKAEAKNWGFFFYPDLSTLLFLK